MKSIIIAGLLFLCFFRPGSVQAVDFRGVFNHVYSGSAPQSTNNAWVDISFVTLSPGNVRMIVANLNLTANENVSSILLNLNPALNPQALHFSPPTTVGNFDLPSISTGTNAFKAGGNCWYDIRFDFKNGGTDKLFAQGETLSYTITGISGLTAADFDYKSLSGGEADPYFDAIHVRRICKNNSGWLAVDKMAPIPEPGCLSIGVLGGIIGVGAVKRRNHPRAVAGR
jgi:hypothetical protein